MRFQLPLLVSTVLAVLISCLGKSEVPAPSSTSVDAGDGDGANAKCAPEGDNCGPDEACCGSVVARRVDLGRTCTGPRTLIACVPAERPGARCVQPAEVGCLMREVDGIQEVYLTETLWRPGQVSGFADCTETLREQSVLASRQICQ